MHLWVGVAIVRFLVRPEDRSLHHLPRGKSRHSASKKLLAGRGVIGKTVAAGTGNLAMGKIRARTPQETNRAVYRDLSGDVPRREQACTHMAPAPILESPTANMKRRNIRPASMCAEWPIRTASNGIESRWSTLKHACQGRYHHLGEKHLLRCAVQFTSRHNFCKLDIVAQMGVLARETVSKWPLYRDLVS